jgi:hypothetical protein
MILIADSGASKTDWRIVDKGGKIEQAQTIGFNPYYQPIEQFDQEVREVLVPQVKMVLNGKLLAGVHTWADLQKAL